MRKVFILLSLILSLLIPGFYKFNTPLPGGILYVPLDNRPVNYKEVIALSQVAGLNLVYPGTGELGSRASLTRWFKKNATRAEAMILSLDQLVYGGLVESRKHNYTGHELTARLASVKNHLPGGAPVYAFISVMRAPVVNTPYTMPDYYAIQGVQIYKYGELLDKIHRGEATTAEVAKFNEIAAAIPEELADFTARRDINHRVAREALRLVQQGYIDYLVVSKDDTTPYGFSSMETKMLQELARELGIEEKVVFFSGTDECGMLLLAAMAGRLGQHSPRVFVDYSQPREAGTVPRYEGVPLSENIARHIAAAGGCLATDLSDSDLVLAVHNGAPEQQGKTGPDTTPAAGGERVTLNPGTAPPGGDSLAAGVRSGTVAASGMETTAGEVSSSNEVHQQKKNAGPDRQTVEFINRIQSYLRAGKPVAIADVKTPNGGDPAFLRQLNQTVDLARLAGYSGWNTAGNSIGAALAQGVLYSGSRDRQTPQFRDKHRAVLLARLVKDWGYQAEVRPAVKKKVPRDQQAMFTDPGLEGQITKEIEQQLNIFAVNNLAEDFGDVTVTGTHLPWHRLFDIDFQVEGQ